MTTRDSKIAIVGAGQAFSSAHFHGIVTGRRSHPGVFGLSTALHLKKQGYRDVTVFDYQPYHQNAYNPADGCDSASSDVNKIYRCSYGTETEYQDLAFSGRPIWQQWNEQIRNTPAHMLPKGLTPSDEVFVPCGFLRMGNGPELSAYDKECLVELEKAGLRHHQHVLKDKADMNFLSIKEKADPKANWALKASTLDHAEGGRLNGFFDTSAGFTYADKACTWARHLAEQAGVKFVLGHEVGKLDELIVDHQDGKKRVKGLKTADGKKHHADVVVVAGGGWTPGLIPEVAGKLEATAGSVITIQLPKDRQDLWDRFSLEKFPVWAYGLTGHNSPEFGGFYGFPRTKDGKLKIGYRGRKWTNYQTNPKTGQRISTPRTKYTAEKAVNLPKKAITNVKTILAELFPELVELGITDTRMCWYTDSLDNSFIIDYVPGYDDSLFVASGGSGHGFKFLPVLGKHVVNALEKRPDQFTPIWKWRSPQPGAHTNGLEEGEMSGRNLAALEIAQESDWIWAEGEKIKLGKVKDMPNGVEKVSGCEEKRRINREARL